MFYKVDSTRISFREYCGSISLRLLPIVLLFKILRIRLSIPMVIPDSLEPYRVKPEDIPDEVRAKIQPLEEQMRGCGFIDPVYHWIVDPFSSRRVCTATYRHQSGKSLGQISFSQQGSRRPPKEVLYPAFLTSFRDGTFFASTAGRRDLTSPPEFKVQRAVGASVPELWKLHSEKVALDSFGKTILSSFSEAETVDLLNSESDIVRNFNVQRGVLVPRSETEQKVVEAVMASPGSETDKTFAAVYAEIESLANRKASWSSSILILLFTVGIFIAMGPGEHGWKPLMLIVGILFFHELGHLAAMRLFKYRNLRMFFIPFLGAAVTGKNYNVPGWKKALVSLMGPLPGIVLGSVLGVLAAMYNWPEVRIASFFLLGLNAFNLLPIMPLDGGQLMHAVLFSRHPMLDVAFRAIAAAILVLSGLLGMRAFMVLGILMFIGLPMTYRVGSVVLRLRRRGLDATSPDARTIPLETARLINEELQQVYPARPNVKTSAQLTLQAFELLNARPPGLLASLALIGLHGFSFLAAVAMLVALSSPWLWNFPHSAISMLMGKPKISLECDKVLTWEGADARKASLAASNTIIANYETRQDAENSYREITAKLPPQAAATLFGQTLMVALPAEDDAARERWFGELEGRCQNISVQSAISRSPFAFSITAPNAEVAERLAKEAEAYLSLPSSMYLIPPWSPEHRLSDADHKARRTYLEIHNQCASFGADPRWNSFSKKIAEAQRRGDAKAVKKLSKEREEASLEIIKEKLQKMREEGKDKWDLSMVDFYEKSPEPKQADIFDEENGMIDPLKVAAVPTESKKELEQWQIRLGSHMGPLPMDGNAPVAAANRFSTCWGMAERNGKTVYFHMYFEQPSAGAPALANWLSQNGCTEMKYEFHLVKPEED